MTTKLPALQWLGNFPFKMYDFAYTIEKSKNRFLDLNVFNLIQILPWWSLSSEDATVCIGFFLTTVAKLLMSMIITETLKQKALSPSLPVLSGLGLKKVLEKNSQSEL